MRQNFINAARKQHCNAQRQRHVNGELALFQSGPGRGEIIAAAVQHYRQAEQDIEIPEKLVKKAVGFFFQTQIFRETEQHDVAESEARHAEFVIKRAVDQWLFLVVQIAKGDGSS